MKHLFSIKGFISFSMMIFLNAFVDLGHKIVIQNSVFKLYTGQQQIVLTAIINALILLPFILLFTPAGLLSDKYPKQKIMKYSAWMALFTTLLITTAYYAGWFWGAFMLTLIMGVQSAIYSPAKYGYIREIAGIESLASANALVQAITIISILLGTLLFSAFFEFLLIDQNLVNPETTIRAIAPLGWLLVGLTLFELAMVYRLPILINKGLSKPFSKASYLKGHYLKKNLASLYHQPVIWLSIIGLSIFWGISQVVLASFPAFAKETLNESNTIIIQGILACTGFGVVGGSLIAGRISRHHIETGLIPVGAIGITLIIALLTTLESRVTMAVSFFFLGLCGGFFIVPLNSLIQYHAKNQQIGIVLAGNNWVQNVTMTAFLALTVVFALLGINSIGLFHILTVIAIAGSLYTIKKLPHSFARIIASFVLKRRYRIDISGFENLPRDGGALLLGNHISWIDWAIVQIACPRAIHFVMLRDIYYTPVFKYIFKAFGAIPIARGHSEEALQKVNQLLQEGSVVCLFPEGTISKDGELGDFKSGYQRAIKGLDVPIIPFFLDGLWGSKFSKSSKKFNPGKNKRDITVAFGEPLAAETRAETLRRKVIALTESISEPIAA